jgi:hypothetical protein
MDFYHSIPYYWCHPNAKDAEPASFHQVPSITTEPLNEIQRSAYLVSSYTRLTVSPIRSTSIGTYMILELLLITKGKRQQVMEYHDIRSPYCTLFKSEDFSTC